MMKLGDSRDQGANIAKASVAAAATWKGPESGLKPSTWAMFLGMLNMLHMLILLFLCLCLLLHVSLMHSDRRGSTGGADSAR